MARGGITSHPALLDFAIHEAPFLSALARGPVGRIVLLAAVDARLREDEKLAAMIEAAGREDRVGILRALLVEEHNRCRLELDRYVRLEAFHRATYDASVDRAGYGRPDTVRESAKAMYATVYPRMVVAVALAVLEGRLTQDEIRRALAERRWPAGLPFAPVLAGSNDLRDHARSPRAREISADEQLMLLDEDEGRPNLRVVSALATRLDAPTVLSVREELAGSLRVVVAEYDAFKADVGASTRARARRMLDLVLHGHTSADVRAQLLAEGYAPLQTNTIDKTWERALARYDLLPGVLCRSRSDFSDTVWFLEELSAAHQAERGDSAVESIRLAPPEDRFRRERAPRRTAALHRLTDKI
jgi:hypothetical protein